MKLNFWEGPSQRESFSKRSIDAMEVKNDVLIMEVKNGGCAIFEAQCQKVSLILISGAPEEQKDGVWSRRKPTFPMESAFTMELKYGAE